MAIKERRLRKWDWSYKLPDETILQDDVIVREISARKVVGQDSECCFEILCYLSSARFTISSLKSYFCIFSRCHRQSFSWLQHWRFHRAGHFSAWLAGIFLQLQRVSRRENAHGSCEDLYYFRCVNIKNQYQFTWIPKHFMTMWLLLVKWLNFKWLSVNCVATTQTTSGVVAWSNHCPNLHRLVTIYAEDHLKSEHN